MSRGAKIALAVVAAVLLLSAACVVASVLAGALTSAGGLGRAQVAVVRVDGVISTASGAASAIGTGATDRRVLHDLETAAADGRVRAIVLAINSPGGSVYASDRIYRALAAMDKPVVAYLGETAASGGYYIACGADRIVAHPTSMTGSIGVISEVIVADELLRKLGVSVEVIKSADAKDMGSPWRKLTDQERGFMQAIVDEAYNEFVNIVSASRDLPREQVLAVADGRVFTGTKAVEYGLADQTGDFEAAVALAGQLGGIQGEPNVLEVTRAPSFTEILLSSATSLTRLLGLDRASSAVLEYRFQP